MKTIRTFTNETEARMSHDLLASKGVKAQVIGAKEYTAHVLGGGLGRFELVVDPRQASKAESILDKVESAKPGRATPDTGTAFKRAIMFGLLGTILLPIIFNIFSVTNGLKFWKYSNQDTGAVVKMFFIGVFQVPAICILIFLAIYLRDHFAG